MSSNHTNLLPYFNETTFFLLVCVPNSSIYYSIVKFVGKENKKKGKRARFSEEESKWETATMLFQKSKKKGELRVRRVRKKKQKKLIKKER